MVRHDCEASHTYKRVKKCSKMIVGHAVIRLVTNSTLSNTHAGMNALAGA